MKSIDEKEVRDKFEAECLGYFGAQETFYAGAEGVGRVYDQSDAFWHWAVCYKRFARVWLTGVRIPMKSATHSNTKSATYSDLKSAGVPI